MADRVVAGKLFAYRILGFLSIYEENKKRATKFNIILNHLQ
jgi:hypothetical protein